MTYFDTSSIPDTIKRFCGDGSKPGDNDLSVTAALRETETGTHIFKTQTVKGVRLDFRFDTDTRELKVKRERWGAAPTWENLSVSQQPAIWRAYGIGEITKDQVCDAHTSVDADRVTRYLRESLQKEKGREVTEEELEAATRDYIYKNFVEKLTNQSFEAVLRWMEDKTKKLPTNYPRPVEGLSSFFPPPF